MIRKLLIALILPVAMLAGCKTKSADSGKPVITVTILPLRYFAEQLAGDHFTINVLVPPGVSHHNYDPTPRQLQEFEKSRALFIIGHLGFEKAWVPKMKSNYPALSVIDLSKGILLISEEGGEGGHAGEEPVAGTAGQHDHEGVDPHYWMSVSEAKKLAVTMAAGLIKADPACDQMVSNNLALLNRKLDSLASSMNQKFSSLSHRSFMIFHPALAYFARDYQFFQHSMELAGKEPTASHFKDLVDLARVERKSTLSLCKRNMIRKMRKLSPAKPELKSLRSIPCRPSGLRKWNHSPPKSLPWTPAKPHSSS